MIYIDISPAVHSRAGMGRYAEKIADEVSKKREVTLFHNQGKGALVPTSLKHLPAYRIQAGYKPWRMAVLMGQYVQIPALSLDKRLPNATIFHATEHLLPPFLTTPTVITIHDIIPRLFPEYHKKLNYWYLNVAMPLYCRRANAIITVSEASKNDLVTHFELPPKKIHVIPEAASDDFFQPAEGEIDRVKAKYLLPDQYLVHVSTIEPRKNLDRLVDALLILREGHPELKLVLVGAKGWLVDDFFQRLGDENLTEIVILPGWVDDEDLPGLIAGASLGVQPSLYEGFGLPILEQMSCGQVVASSNTSSLPEVGGDAAAYFDPTSVSEMVAVIDRLLRSPDEYRQRQEMGLKQAKKFSWKKAAAETMAVYDQVREQYAAR
ncbi:MAG: glycosyltransferase family 4 protein [Anaerolineae bacterium]